MTANFDLSRLEDIIKDEINVKEIRVVQSDAGFVRFSFKLNLKAAGKKYGKFVGPVQNHLKQLSASQTKVPSTTAIWMLRSMVNHCISYSMIYLWKNKPNEGFASASGYQMTVALNTTITEELEQEGVVREVIRAIQDYRKKLELPIEKRVNLVLDVE